MNKRKEDLLNEATKLENQAKRMREEADEAKDYDRIVELLDSDLKLWKEHLVQHAIKAGPAAWKLMFWSQDYQQLYSVLRHGYAVSIDQQEPWSFEQYLKSEQNVGPVVIAYADSPAVLFHPNAQSRLRLELAGLVYLICPANYEVGNKELCKRYSPGACDPLYLFDADYCNLKRLRWAKRTHAEFYQDFTSESYLAEMKQKLADARATSFETRRNLLRQAVVKAKETLAQTELHYSLLQTTD